MKRNWLLVLLLALGSCKGGAEIVHMDELPDVSLAASQVKQAIYDPDNKLFSPTLYQNLSEKKQNSIVSLCVPDELGMNEYFQGCYCTGTLISPHVVLTAGHCLSPYWLDNSTLTPTKGELPVINTLGLEIRLGPNNSEPLQTYEVKEIHAVDITGERKWISDIGVVILKDGEYTTEKISIKRGGISAAYDQKVQAVGFGRSMYQLSENDPDYVPYVPNIYRRWCTRETGDVDFIKPPDAYAGVLPTFSIENPEHPEVMSCHCLSGDSGSPLLYDFGDGVQVIGDLSSVWADINYYAPINLHEDWVQSFVDKFDNPDCVNACTKVECGEIGTCYCDNCGDDMECSPYNKCRKKVESGICVTNELLNGGEVAASCTQKGDCSATESCFTGNDNGACVKNCELPVIGCSDRDPRAFCLPILIDEDVHMNFCLEGNSPPCAEEGASCVSADGSEGLCAKPFKDKGLTCLKTCYLSSICPDQKGCMPYDPAEPLEYGLQAGDPDTCRCDLFDYCETYCACDKDCNGDTPIASCSCDKDSSCQEGCACDKNCTSGDNESAENISSKKSKKGCQAGGSEAPFFLLGFWLIWLSARCLKNRLF